MIQLNILNGKKAGQEIVARLFPFQIGRATAAHLKLDEDGVWEKHLEIILQSGEGFLLQAHPQALVTVNGEAVRQATLRNGDLIEAGSVQLRFWLSPVRQRSLLVQESLTWFALTALFFVELGLLYWLLFLFNDGNVAGR